MLATGVYCWLNTVNGKCYVGSAARSIRTRREYHQQALRGNYHCNRHLQGAWNRYGEQAFEFLVLVRCAPEHCLVWEQYYIDEFESANPKYGYNLCPKAGNRLGFKFSEESRRRLSEAIRGQCRPHKEETKAQISATLKRMHAENPELGKQWALPRKGNEISVETRKKISNTLKGHTFSEETRNKISATLTGRKLSAATIAKRTEKQRPGLIARNKSAAMRRRVSKTLEGHAVSAETRLKIAATLRGRPSPKKGVPMKEEQKRKVSAGLHRYFQLQKQKRALG